MPHYSMVLQWSEEDKGYIATVPELPGLSAFGPSPDEACKQLLIAKKAFLEVMAEDGEEIPDADILRPFSGQTRLRLPKTLHASLSLEAKRNGVSLNTYIVMLLSGKSGVSQIMDSVNALENRIHSFMLTNSSSMEQITTELLLLRLLIFEYQRKVWKRMKLADKTYSILCDDVRLEIGNKHSLMGVYAGTIIVTKVPSLLPKVCLVLCFEKLRKEMPHDGRLRLLGPGWILSNFLYRLLRIRN